MNPSQDNISGSSCLAWTFLICDGWLLEIPWLPNKDEFHAFCFYRLLVSKMKSPVFSGNGNVYHDGDQKRFVPSKGT
jgi:hypothetical protein